MAIAEFSAQCRAPFGRDQSWRIGRTIHDWAEFVHSREVGGRFELRGAAAVAVVQAADERSPNDRCELQRFDSTWHRRIFFQRLMLSRVVKLSKELDNIFLSTVANAMQELGLRSRVSRGIAPTATGRRTILGLRVSLSEAEVHWRDFLASLQQRRLHGVQLRTRGKPPTWPTAAPINWVSRTSIKNPTSTL